MQVQKASSNADARGGLSVREKRQNAVREEDIPTKVVLIPTTKPKGGCYA
jgi:hypothetical protein